MGKRGYFLIVFTLYGCQLDRTLEIRLSGYQIIGLALLFCLFIVFIGWAWSNRKLLLGKESDQMERHVNIVGILKNENRFMKERNQKLFRHFSCQTDRVKQLHVVLGNRLKSLQHLLELGSVYENKTEVFYKKFREHMCLEAKNKAAFADLYELTDLYCNGVAEYLKNNYPLLNDEDLRLCCMIALGFSSQEIRLIFSHTNKDSIYTKRSKLRTKLKLSPEMNLETFIRNMIVK